MATEEVVVVAVEDMMTVEDMVVAAAGAVDIVEATMTVEGMYEEPLIHHLNC
jgi:hypothetical protein